MVESKVSWTFLPPQSPIKHLSLLKTRLDSYEMAAMESIKQFLCYNPILGNSATYYDILFGWESLGKNVQALRLAGIHRLPVEGVEPRCMTMEGTYPYFPSWTIHTDNDGAPIFMEASKKYRGIGDRAETGAFLLFCRDAGFHKNLHRQRRSSWKGSHYYGRSWQRAIAR